jgi:hypothetical protein
MEITEGFVNDYKSNIELLLQQKDSRLAQAVTTDSYTGEGGRPVEQIGAVAPRRVTGRHEDTPIIETPHDSRWVEPNDYDWGDLIDNEDKLRRLVDPQSAYVQNGMAAMRRAKDDEIIAAMFSDVTKTGKAGGTTTSWATFVAANTTHLIAHGSVGLTIDKLRAAKKALMAAEVDIDNDPLFCAISAVQHDNLLAETQAISLDYTTRPVLMEGKITSFMGFNFIHSERLPVASSIRGCPIWAKSGMHLGTWNDLKVRVSERSDKRYSVQVYVCSTIGATRLEEKKMVECLCSEA